MSALHRERLQVPMTPFGFNDLPVLDGVLIPLVEAAALAAAVERVRSRWEGPLPPSPSLLPEPRAQLLAPHL